VISRDEAQGRLIAELLAHFGGEANRVMAHLLKSGQLTLEDLEETTVWEGLVAVAGRKYVAA